MQKNIICVACPMGCDEQEVHRLLRRIFCRDIVLQIHARAHQQPALFFTHDAFAHQRIAVGAVFKKDHLRPFECRLIQHRHQRSQRALLLEGRAQSGNVGGIGHSQ